MAALALYDGEAEITSANISALLDASNNKVAPYWPGFFASILADGKIEDILYSVGSSGAAPVAAGAAAAGGDNAEEKKEEKPKEEEVDALDGGMDMFGGGGGGGDY